MKRKTNRNLKNKVDNFLLYLQKIFKDNFRLKNTEESKIVAYENRVSETQFKSFLLHGKAIFSS